MVFLDPILAKLEPPKNRVFLNGQICGYLNSDSVTKKAYFDSLAVLLKQPENYRLILYLPFIFPEPGEHTEFKETYLNAWQQLLDVEDPREDFNLGDDSDEHVVKARHLIPWLLRSHMIAVPELKTIFWESNLFRLNGLHAQNFHEGVSVAEKLGILPPQTAHFFKRLSNSAKEGCTFGTRRSAWAVNFGLSATTHTLKDFTSFAKLEDLDLADLQPSTEEFYLVTGSAVQNYGDDLKVYRGRFDSLPYCRDESGKLYNLVHPDSAWLTLTAIWIGTDERVEELRERLTNFQLSVKDHRPEIYCAYRKDKIPQPLDFRAKILRDLERVLLQDELMHKTFHANFDNISAETSSCFAIDGSSAFYDDRYRRVATEIFVKYLWLPTPTTPTQAPF